MQKTSSSSQTSYNCTQQNEFPLVSVVITTKNEEKNIENCLRSIREQTFAGVELIVVDNFSEDRTAEIAKQYDAKVYFKGNERSAQRNYGAEVASGKYLLYLDADMILSPSLIEDCMEKSECAGVDALYIPEKIVGKGFWVKVRDFERSFYTGTVIDAVRFLKRQLFLDVGGFDEALVGPEDWDFDRKIRQVARTSVADVSLYHNEGKFDSSRYLKKKGYYSVGIQKYVEKWGSSDKETLKQTGLRYRMIGVFVEQGKWKKLFRHPILTIAMYCLRFRVALQYYKNRSKKT